MSSGEYRGGNAVGGALFIGDWSASVVTQSRALRMASNLEVVSEINFNNSSDFILISSNLISKTSQRPMHSRASKLFGLDDFTCGHFD